MAVAEKQNKKTRSKNARPPKAKQEVKTRRVIPAKKKHARTYTAEELGVPKLNGIIPAGIQKTKGKKKGKVFVDDAETMLAIMGMVQAEKEGEREGKIMKQRQLEEIREAKRLENEKKANAKQSELEQVKDEIRKDQKPKSQANQVVSNNKFKKKRVSFG